MAVVWRVTVAGETMVMHRWEEKKAGVGRTGVGIEVVMVGEGML